MKNVVKKIVTGTALIISGYGIANALKAAKASADAKKEKERKLIRPSIIITASTDPHSEECKECHRCTCHGVPAPDAKASEKELRCFLRYISMYRQFPKGKIPSEEEKKYRIIEANTVAMDSLDPDDRAFMEGFINFLRESELTEELDKSVTTAALIGYMKENGIFDDIHHICKKKDIACDDIEGIIHAVFKAGKFGKHMDAEQKLSVILDDLSDDYFDSDLDDFDGSDYE